eukprot:1517917-Prymnesium_polylepis.1
MSGEVDEKRVLVLEAGAVPPLVVLLSASDAEGRRAAAGALAMLACSEDGKQRVREAGAIPALIGLLG